MLELPKTLTHVQNENSSPSVLKEGFEVFANEDTGESIFDFFAVVNINNPKLWDLFKSLSFELPELVCLVFNKFGEEPNYGRYTDRQEILDFLEGYQKEILTDCDLKLSLVFSVEDELIQVEITEAKYIRFWGVNVDSFKEIMSKFMLNEVEGILLPDATPMQVIKLKSIDETAKETSELISVFKENFIV
jgi:hypothetical protein